MRAVTSIRIMEISMQITIDPGHLLTLMTQLVIVTSGFYGLWTFLKRQWHRA